jgi:glucosamine kinase
MNRDALLLGIDGGGTRCRARLCATSGERLGEATAGPANIRYGLEQSFGAVLRATMQCLKQAELSQGDLHRIVACLALAGASEPGHLAAAQNYEHPFRKAIVTTDAHAACIGAHDGRDGGVVIVGTGTIGWAELEGQAHRVGGWGLPVSDEGSGAWLGLEALRRVLWAHDGRRKWTPMLHVLFERFQSNPHAIVQFTFRAKPRDFALLAPFVVKYASQQDEVAVDLMRSAASHIDILIERLVQIGTRRIALLGGLADIEPWLTKESRRYLVPPTADALEGALRLARMVAEATTVPEHPLADELVLKLR